MFKTNTNWNGGVQKNWPFFKKIVRTEVKSEFARGREISKCAGGREGKVEPENFFEGKLRMFSGVFCVFVCSLQDPLARTILMNKVASEIS